MKKIINFLFYCVVNTVPEKAIFGRWQVACTLFSSISFLLFLSLFFIINDYINYPRNNLYFTVGFIICYIFLFYFVRKVYLNDNCKTFLTNKFGKYSKGLLKVFGYIYLIMCYASLIIVRIVTL
jgi:hypothetical protein